MRKRIFIHSTWLLLGGCFLALSLSACSSEADAGDVEEGIAIATLEGQIGDALPVTRTHISNGEAGEGGDVNGSDLKTVFDVGDLIYASLSYEHDGQVHPYYYMGGNTFVSTNSPLIINKNASPSQHLIAFYRGDLKRRLNHGLSFDVLQDQSTEYNHQASEFIYGHAALTSSNVDVNTNFPELTFYHKTARIILRIQCPSGTGYDVSKISKVEIGNGVIYRRGTVKLDESTGDATINVLNAASSSVYSGTNSGYITAYRRIKSAPTSGAHSEMWASIVFPPQSIAATSNFFKVTYDGGDTGGHAAKTYYFHLLKDASFTDSNKKPFLENHAYYYAVTVGDHSAIQK